MQKNEVRKMADIIEAFSKINSDIVNVFEKMQTKMAQYEDFTSWTKHEKSKRNSKKDYYDYDDFLDGYWYVKNSYGQVGTDVYGFTFLIYIDTDESGYNQEFIEYLDRDLNPKVPMLCVYGVYRPVDPEKIEFTQDDDEDDTYQWYMDIIKIKDGWKNFAPELLRYNQTISVETNYLAEDGNINSEERFDTWFKKANIKIIPITDMESSKKIEETVEDLMSMKI